MADDDPLDRDDGQPDLLLLRRYEPVVRFTRGEVFLPMPIESYLAACELWQGGPRRPGRRDGARRLCDRGELTPDRLAEVGAAAGSGSLSLRFVEPLSRAEYRAWRREPERVRFVAGSSRFAAVGLVGRLIDAVMRLSLLVRGRVPGGAAAAAELSYRSRADPHRCAYYGHVTRDGGFVVLQYWFFYAMNDWRSRFGGVNDHEADWEQVTLFLPDPPDPDARPAWVALSAHDEVGADLRRRCDDPDITWHGTHPVVFAGAGSHSGAYLPGDYLVTVEPPALRRLVAELRRVSRLLLPWTRGRAGHALGIPFIDYHRGDGPAVGSGEQREWAPVLLDEDTPWVRLYRGLWGLDTGDPFGGERAPAGPRYERDERVRLSWSDPVGWAALDGQPPSPAAEQQAVADRVTELDGMLGEADAELRAGNTQLRRLQVGLRALDGAGRPHRTAAAVAEERVAALRERRRALAEELEALRRAASQGLPPVHPHAHLRHRRLPDVGSGRSRKRVLGWWSAVSASFLLAGLAVVLLEQTWTLVPAAVGVAFVTLCAEAFARGRLVLFLGGLLAAAVVVNVVWAAAYAALGHWRVVGAALLLAAAVVLLLANVRDFVRKR
jgi:hypothetical protein